MENMVFAFLADIKSSRSMNGDERFSMQNRFRNAIENLNNIFGNEMLAPLCFSAGDSVQCLFKSASASIRCYLLFSTFFFPYRIRAGIGAGDINRNMLEEEAKNGRIDSIFLDGPAYHFAKKALGLAKEYDARVLVVSNECDQNRVINNMLIEASNHRRKLSTSQERLLTLCEFINPILNEEESVSYSNSFSELLPLMPVDKTVSMKKNLFNLFRDGRKEQSERRLTDRSLPIFSAQVMSRNSDGRLAKILNVSPQNIWLLKKRGNMDAIRTLEMLATKTFDA